mmetsp:Transcript_6236/g.17431  ORF Transcript_6236/g.17431 Transcript_6236/m.17431 type:complete len:337 (+) Transcript_6236:385-1395(+)
MSVGSGHMRASAAARARSGPMACESSSATSMNRLMSRPFTRWRSAAVALPTTPTRRSSVGRLRCSASKSYIFMSRRAWANSPTLQSMTLVPERPARPVRPERCTKVSVSSGSVWWMTSCTCETSRPRAATSVATSTRQLPLRKAFMASSRSFWPMSPFSAAAPKARSKGDRAMLLLSRLVLVKMMQVDGPPSASASLDMCSASTAARASSRFRSVTMVATWRMVLGRREEFSPTMSMLSGASRKLPALLSTQAGFVADHMLVQRSSFSGSSPKMCSTSSAKPMRSISSASSSTAKRTLCRSRMPSSMRSMQRPGVATTTSTPRRSSPICGPRAAPP